MSTIVAIGNRLNQRSEPIQWAGGKLWLRLSGMFLTGNGIGTCVELQHRHTPPDGSPPGTVLPPPPPPRRFSTAGEWRLALSPGEFSLHFSGPDLLPWEVTATIEESVPQAEVTE
jgi:hypothetical protein